LSTAIELGGDLTQGRLEIARVLKTA